MFMSISNINTFKKLITLINYEQLNKYLLQIERATTMSFNKC